MKFGSINIVLGVLLIWQSFVINYGGWLLAWLGLCFVALGAAHFANFPRLFGKNSQGKLPLWSQLTFLPLHVYTHLVWHAIRSISKEPAFASVTDQILIGRRLVNGEFPTGIDVIVDLTAEFSEPQSIASSARYLSFPILDAAVPETAAFQSFLQEIPLGRCYIHCAQGHGRTGLFASAYLIHCGIAPDVKSALDLLVAARPALRLNREQRSFLDRLYLTGELSGK